MLPVVPGTFVVGSVEEVPFGHEIAIGMRRDAQVVQIQRVAAGRWGDEENAARVSGTYGGYTVFIEIVEQSVRGEQRGGGFQQDVERQQGWVVLVVIGHGVPPISDVAVVPSRRAARHDTRLTSNDGNDVGLQQVVHLPI